MSNDARTVFEAYKKWLDDFIGELLSFPGGASEMVRNEPLTYPRRYPPWLIGEPPTKLSGTNHTTAHFVIRWDEKNCGEDT